MQGIASLGITFDLDNRISTGGNDLLHAEAVGTALCPGCQAAIVFEASNIPCTVSRHTTGSGWWNPILFGTVRETSCGAVVLRMVSISPIAVASIAPAVHHHGQC
ncbi:unnamed protein product [Ostreobium quekettii]|uniref:Uncharacterized protein n=1 Tax=Ostreobium quekettii TaxID=121088 RepID=A0A8S1IY93_9CHLO|nr:unnamed protein product [Ostreobium quekettii]|eukprot:evm.model.scf_1427.2 EVM.evm.TU.scf_1427.2   scf_1427:12322-12636(-)